MRSPSDFVGNPETPADLDRQTERLRETIAPDLNTYPGYPICSAACGHYSVIIDEYDDEVLDCSATALLGRDGVNLPVHCEDCETCIPAVWFAQNGMRR